jgi:hypothetical protein
MNRERPILHCRCIYCGFEWDFEAKSKSDAARMNGPSVCTREECTDKLTESIVARILEQEAGKSHGGHNEQRTTKRS